MPLAQGGLGLQSATATAPAAYWASWADTLPTLARQLPAFTARVQDFFSNPARAPPSIQAAHQAAGTLSANGWNPPTWHDLTNGTSPPRPADIPHEEPTARGRQHKAANVIQTRCRAQLFTALDPASSQAMLTSQAGPHSSRAFTTIPFRPDFHYPSHLFRILLLRRPRLPLQLAAQTCRRRRTLDLLGDHRAACAQSGVLQSRGGALERAAARVCREAGARVTTHTLLSDLNVPSVDRFDNRGIEVIANGLPLHRAYPELLRGGRCKLVVVALEVAERWSTEAASFIRQLAQTRCRAAPALQTATAQAYIARWSALLTHAAQTAFAKSLLFEDLRLHTAGDGESPLLSDLLDLHTTPPDISRLPP